MAQPLALQGNHTMTKSRRNWLVVVLLAIVVVAGLAWIKNRSILVSTVAVEKFVPVQVYGLGTIEARIVSRLGFDVTGTIIELTADHGDLVKRGDILAHLSAGEQRARVAKATAGLQKAEAALVQAHAKFSRAATVLEQKRSANLRRRTLVRQGAVSAETAEEIQANLDIAVADIAVAKSDVEAATGGVADARADVLFENELLAKLTLIAPFDGVVGARAKELGSVMAPGTTIYTLIDPETLWIMAFVDESLAGDIRLIAVSRG